MCGTGTDILKDSINLLTDLIRLKLIWKSHLASKVLDIFTQIAFTTTFVPYPV